MLEIKNVTKIYDSKGGIQTRALDGVSITFGETGLVFLLGKSGSGKSTLLNVCGGLDAPTSGEIIVKGKSSKNFSGSDFDSYRNTFVGFIFQEYNVLDEFNVEDNIALALELQGKPKDKERIAELLQTVDMASFAKRKPNTLSGGQKQRIAIARALIKEPQIIMADEPTGALDSATGKQVLETLKKLSETRLVIIVSHDREFAETYGDRIVELSDGKIISDVTKSEIPAKTLDENITAIGENTLKIKSGEKLTESNLKAIQEFISTGGDVIISKGESEIAAFSKAARIKSDGATEKFGETDVSAIEVKEYSAEESKLIRSRLPAGKAVKIGASGLKLKPVRLVFTILLSVIAFTMFGLFSTLMLYDGDRVAVKSFAASDYSYFNIINKYEVREFYGDDEVSVYSNVTGMTEDGLAELKNKFSQQTFGYFSVGEINIGNVKTPSQIPYWSSRIMKCAYVPEGHGLRTEMFGAYPSNENEICISSYMLEMLKNSEVYAVTPEKPEYSEKDIYSVSNHSDIIGKYLTVSLNGRKVYKVTGVFDSGKIPAKYDEMKIKGNEHGFILQYEFMSYMSESMNLMVLTSENFAAENKLFYADNNAGNKNYFDYIYNNLDCEYDDYEFDYDTMQWESTGVRYPYIANAVSAYGTEEMLPITFFNGKNEVSGNELVLNIRELGGYANLIQKQIYERELEKDSSLSSDEAYYRACEYFNGLQRKIDYYFGGVIYDDNGGVHELTEEERAQLYKEIVTAISEIQPLKVRLTIDGNINLLVTVVGFFINPANVYMDGIYVSQQFIDEYLTVFVTNTETNYVPTGDEKYYGAFIPYDGSETMAREIMDFTGGETKGDNDLYFEIYSELYSMIEMANGTVNVLKIVFLSVGIVFAVFASLLMFNFISMSISSKRKEIGILRAVGARGADVFRIFFAESGIIVGICTVLAMILSVVVTSAINSVLKSEIGLEVTLFMFGFASAGVMLGIAVLVAVVATFLPVYFAARKKPVEAIRAL